ncbi:uncharacterized protein K452DRAFT_288844 [Aplosporella prunicola CBS 121167]|uniref:Translation initiation factor 3 N-terminal domain-containing protein n=1 Tax=Aplosporella prunicola CBS 121167 TaxID=1176127 RepID=A0A6A6BCX8_9PEZI|nr:uncharacterized protein K452DRAFT_288844 [Aplosporella prunicola CBS 121167]KAF2140757.1 hypothetical protein K452DRAFT_288844 [Aplosporella prunicola CBS 121167]
MRARHLSTTAQALYRVFVQPSLSVPARLPVCARPFPAIAAVARCSPAQIRTAVSVANVKQQLEEERPPYNDEIESDMINIVEEDGTFRPNLWRDDVLRRMNRTTHHLVQVGAEGQNSKYPNPTCKVLSKIFLRQQDNEKLEKLKKKTKSVEDLSKTIELNWGVSDHDLSHWMKRLVEFLEEGRRVTIVLGPKKRARKASQEEAEAALAKVRATVKSVKGARERTEPIGEVGAVMTMVFDGKEKAPEEVEEMERGKKEAKEAKKKEKNKDGKVKVSRYALKQEEKKVKEEEEKYLREVLGSQKTQRSKPRGEQRPDSRPLHGFTILRR